MKVFRSIELTWAAVSLSFMVCSLSAYAGVSMEGIPSATHAAESKAYFSQRAERVLREYAGRDLEAEIGALSPEFANVVLAKLALNQDIEAVNRAILDPRVKVYAPVGSSLNEIGPICRREGNYDFFLRAIIPVAFQFKDAPEKLWPEARQKLIFQLLNTTGNEAKTRFSLPKPCGTYPETENHILQTESSRLLTNDLITWAARTYGAKPPKALDYYDNAKNGMNAWVIKYLQQFLVKDFAEYNSRPYQGHTVLSISNLYEYATDPKVRVAAQMVLDYLSAKFAYSSESNRRLVPFRRKPKYLERMDILAVDREAARMFLQAGNLEALRQGEGTVPLPGGVYMLPALAVGTYFPPDFILDELTGNADSRRSTSVVRIRHRATEIHEKADSYLLSGGGNFTYNFGYFTDEQNGWAVPTSLIPRKEGVLVTDWLRFNGHRNRKYANNTCIGPSFACGVNLVIPESIPLACRIKEGNWTFLRLDETCEKNWGFNVAIFSRACESSSCRVQGKNYGFFEVSSTKKLDFDRFKAGVLAVNGKKKFPSRGIHRYVNAQGTSIEFDFLPRDNFRSPIHSVGGVKYPKMLSSWPFLSGNRLKSGKKPGEVTIQSAKPGTRLVLDFSDPKNPRRTLVQAQAGEAQ